MAKRKAVKIERKPNYIVEDYRNPPEDQVLRYRRKKVGNHVLTIAVVKGKGPRGGADEGHLGVAPEDREEVVQPAGDEGSQKGAQGEAVGHHFNDQGAVG